MGFDMNFIPKRRKRQRADIRESPWWRSERHKKHVRGFDCSIKDKNGHVCQGRIEAAHDRDGTDGCGQRKPSDFHCFPLCSLAHGEQHTLGHESFDRKYGIKTKAITAHMVKTSPCRQEIEEWQRYRLQHKENEG